MNKNFFSTRYLPIDVGYERIFCIRFYVLGDSRTQGRVLGRYSYHSWERIGVSCISWVAPVSSPVFVAHLCRRDILCREDRRMIFERTRIRDLLLSRHVRAKVYENQRFLDIIRNRTHILLCRWQQICLGSRRNARLVEIPPPSRDEHSDYDDTNP